MIAFDPKYVKVAGDITSALLLSQLVYWFKPGKGGKSKLTITRGGKRWLAKSRRELAEECGLTERQVKSAMEKLRAAGVIETEIHLWNNRTTPYIWVDAEALANRLGTARPSGWTAEVHPYSGSSESTAETTAVARSAKADPETSGEEPVAEKPTDLNEILKMHQAKQKGIDPANANTPMKLIFGWKKIVAEVYGGFVKDFTYKEQGQVSQFIKKVGPDKAAEVMFGTLKRWGAFCFEAKQAYGLKVAPDKPSIGFLLQYHDVAVQLIASQKKPTGGVLMSGKAEEVTPPTPKCEKCGKSDAMVKHPDGKWVCHHTHLLEKPKEDTVSADKVAAALAKFKKKDGGSC